MISSLLLLLFTQVMPLPQDSPEVRRGESHLRGERWEAAAESFEAATRKDPSNGLAWFQLAYALHAAGEYERALEAHEQAARFPEYTATALYNQACSLALLERVEEASAVLERALEAGFLDYDLLADDPDLAEVRARADVVLPPELDYAELRARNGRIVRYRVLLPEPFDADAEHPVLVAFPPGGQGVRSADWSIEHLWKGALADSSWILVVPVAPEEGWMNHPSHHALDDLLRQVSRDYRVEGDEFHAFGFGSGARPASSFSRMSKRYFQSLTVAAGSAWGGWSHAQLREFRDAPVHQIVGANDAHRLSEARGPEAAFDRHGVDATLTVVPDSGVLLEGLRGRELLAAIASVVRPMPGVASR